MNRTSRIHQHRRVVMLVLALLIGGVLSLLQSATTNAHNLQTRMVYMFFDPATQACLDARIENTPLPPGCAPLPGGWMPGDPILLANDELGVIIKVVPRDGTTTGVGGHIDFYVPNGVEVVDVAYVVPDGSGDFTKVAMKGQSPIAIGAGPIGPKTTAELIGLNDVYSSAASGLSSTAVNPATGLHWGTIAGVYGDTGIFYATDPDTAYGSWQTFTGDSTANGCGSLAFNPTALGKTLVNNSGDTVIPCNKWDAGQLMAWGVKGGTYGQSAPIVDYGDGRGNAPWGFANGVAGPQSGYSWEFDWDEWNASAKNAAAMRAAMSNDSIGPWKRIQYAGDRVSYDQPALLSTVLGFANIDAGNQGVPVSALPATTSQTDNSSPKAIRWAVGQLTAFRPEYAYVKIKVDNPLAGITNPSGCPDLRADTFGGDAGGTDNGKDHLWRYYEPTEVKLNMCLTAGKPATEEFVRSGQVFQYPIKVYNLQDFALTNVVVKDFLGGGLTFLSSVPAQNSGPNPLIYNVGTLLPGQKFEALVTVRASSTGFLDNCIEVSSTQLPTQKACDTTISGPNPFLVPSKTARSSAVAPGGTVIYDVLVRNIGAGPTGNPVTIRDYLPTGFTYDATFTPVVYINGALITPTVNATNPSEPVFTIPAALLADKEITIAFRAKVSPAAAPGLYCNSYSVTQNGVPITTGSEACVSVAGGKIGDFIWRDWDGDGAQDAGEEGISGVTVKLFASDGTTLLATTTTDANGNYYFNGLTAGTYVVEVNNGAALPGTVQTGDPDSACPGANCNNRHTVTLATDQQYLTADFGYKPTGAGSIGDKVFEDIANDGAYNSGTDFGIPNVTVWLYEDSNNDGLIDAGDALVATTTSNGTGDYLFSNLATGFNYLVKVNKNDPDIQTYFDNKYNPDPVPYQLSTLEISPSPNLTGADLDNDFGFWRVVPGSIGDQVFIDNNGDGLYNAGDAPLAGITVTLYLDGVPVGTTSSGPDGLYLFDNLGPGNYTVVVDETDPDLPGGLFTTVHTYNVILTAGQNYLTADFPFVKGTTKTVDLAYATPGQTLNFTIRPFYPDTDLLTNARIIDPIPAGTTYVGGSANAGGVFGAYTPIAAVPGNDPAGGPLETTTLDTAITVSTNFVNVGGSVNVTLNVKSTVAVSNVAPMDFASNVNTATCTGPTPASGNVPAGGAGINFVWACTLTGTGEYTFSSGAEDALSAYSWPTASSATVLAAPGGGPNVVTWNLGSNVAGVPGETIDSGYTAGVYGLAGNNKKGFSKYTINNLAWSDKAQPTNGIEKGGALTNAGGGILYASEGNAKIFYSYNIATNTWTQLANASDNFNEGGGIQYLNVGGTHYVYAVLGNSKRFRRYNIAGNNWTNLADTPENIKQGGALTTDGTYLYALRGDGKKDFYRYNVGTDTWSAMASTPENVKWGGALTYANGYIYAFRGDNKKNFWRYDIAANSWSSMTSAPGNVSEGGALTTDGSAYIYAFQGRSKAFWRYTIATNQWEALISVNFPDNVGKGGSLVYDPGLNPQGRASTLVATPSLVPAGGQIAVEMRFQSTTAINNVAASALTVTPTGGASCSTLTGPVLVSADDDIANVNDDVRYQWTCTVAATTTPSSLRFSASGTGAGPVAFPLATSRSVLVTPLLTFQATVNNPAPTSGVIYNTALLVKAGPAPNTYPTNTTETFTSASIGDYVWADLDGDGLQDGNEVGLSGVRVYVDSDNDNTWDPGEPYDITDAAGAYRIGNLPPGNYTVRSDPTTWPAGYLPTTPITLAVSLIAGQQYNLADYGLKPPGTGSIGDTVWLDKDNDGVLDGDEVGLPNITVNLEILVNAVWIPVASTVTDANGVYTFNGLIADDYRVTVDQNSTVTSPYGPGSFTLGAAMDPTYDKDGLGTPNVTQVTLATDSTVFTDVDFGYNWSGSIGDYVWWDYNADGLQNDGAPSAVGIQNAAVLLYVDANNNGILDPANGDYQINTALTNSNGGYLFSNLPPGRYLVDVYEDSITVGGIRDIVPTTANVVFKNLGAGENYLAADFGYFEGARVEGNVFHDDDRNGLFESGENGLAGITVTLTGTDMFNNPISQTTTTDANGHFVFIVPEGDYTLTYNTTQTTTAGYPDATTPTTLNFHAYPGEDWHPVLDFGVDYGGSIGDFVWNDANGDGDQDLGEPGIPGVTLNLYLDADGNPATTGDQTFLAATATDSFGEYEFPGLNNTTGPQKYVVKVNTATLPAGFTPTGEGQPGTPCGGGCDNQIATALAGGATITNVDFGYKPPVNTYPISGTVWNDNGAGGGGAGNGVQAGTEPGIPGVTVCLYDSTGTTIITCVVTDANGNYTFPGNPNGNYIIKVDPTTLPSNGFYQTGDPDSVCPSAGCNNQTPVTVAGAPVTDKDFGYLEDLGSISGTVCDGNGDGLCDDPGDVPYTEVVVTLRYAGDDGILNTPDDVVQNQTTVNGEYSFTGLEPGQYQITIATPANRANLADADGGNPNNITPVLTLGQDLANQDFELKREIGVIGDRVWLDEDGDGQQDAGEDGIPNAKVQLYASDGTTLLATTYTDANGNYIFPSLSAGTYVVKVDPASLPAGLAANPTYDENGTGTPNQTTVALAAGEEHDTADFGYNWAPPTDTDNGTGTGAIGDRVWVDTDGDGIQDPGEPGLGGVTVQLVTAGPDGLFGTGDDVVAASTTTNPSGNYIFDGLAPGSYVVRVPATPGGYTQTGDPDGTLDNKTTQPVSLAPGDVYVNADFGYQPDGGTSGSIGDTVWLDADRDNTVDAGEPGLAGVTVALIRDLNSNGVWDAGEPIIATDTTDAAGQYLFTGLPVTDGTGSDDYIVWVNDTANVLAGLAPVYDVRDGGSQGNPATGVVTGLGISAVTNLTTTAVTNADFAYAPAGHEPGEGLIGDTIFLDRNTSNTPDPGEGLEGVTVELYASDGTTLLQTAVTNENGQYFFGDLNPTATYVVKVVTSTLPAGVTNTYDPDGGAANQSTVNLSVVGPINLLQDFGYRDTSNPNTISGTVWKDLDGDGTLEGGEPGRWAGVTVVLRDANGNVVATTTTDANGNFSFTNLPDGTYKVDVTDDNNVLAGTWKSTGPTPGADGNSQNDPYTVTVSGGQTNTTADFGYFIDSATLGNRVWSDVDGDGIQDPGEPGVAGVEVTLTIKYFGGTNVVLKTTTDANGFYSFGNLLLDEDHLSSKTGSPTATQPVYTVSVAIPNGYTASPVDQGGNDMVDSDNHAGVDALFAQGQTNVAVNADPSLESNPNAGYDFGLDPPAAKLHLDLVKTVNNTSPSPGTNIIYTITYSSIIVNGESDTGSSLVVTDNLQLGLEYVSAIPVGAGSCSFNAAYDPPNYSGRVTCSGLPNLAPNQSGVIHLTAKVKETQGNYGFGNTIDNTAVVNGIGLVSGLPASDDGSVIVTTPVTVSYFKAAAIEGGTRFEWETATETANAGFNLYVERNGSPVLINEVMVVSSAPDSSTPQSYEYEAAGVEGQVFYIEDISLFGETRMHGPFNLGEEYGARADVEAIDWAAIAAENAAADTQVTAAAPQPFGPAAEGVGVTTGGTDSSLSAAAVTYPAIEVRVDKTGIYRLTYEQILAATNVNLRGVPSKNLALTNNGVPVPIYTFKAKFGPGAYIEFLGEALDTLYTDTNVYRLEVNPALAKRVKVDTRAPSTVTPSATYMETKLIERNLDYSTLVPQGSDPWYDTWVLAPKNSPQTRTFTINIDGYAGGSGDTVLLLNLVGSSNYIAGPEHKVRVSLNGQFVAEDVFDDRQVRSLRISLPAGLLVNGNNTLSLYLPSDLGAPADAVFIESYGVVYPRTYAATDGRITFEASGDVFKVTNLNANKVIVYRVDGDQVTLFSRPKVVKVRGVTPATFEARMPGSATPATYYVSTAPSLLTPQIGLARVPANINSGAADLLIIAHPDFINGFAPLVTARQAEGLTVKVVNVLDIYATYSHGVFDAEAIRQYIHHAIQNLGVDYIILGGGDTLDYHNYKGNGSISFVPSLYAETLAPVSHAPADPLYADVDGDGLPDAAVGRFPVRTVAELNYMVAKTLTYGQPGAALTAVLAADKGFEGDSELLASALTGWDVDKAYVRTHGIGTARTTLLTALNEGQRLTSFIGHSGQRNWTFDPLLLASQVTGLTNTNPTVVTQWGCWNAYYVEPTYDTFGHTFLLSGLNGAALVTGSTTLTTASAEQSLGRIMMPQLVADGMRIGDAMRLAKNQLAQTSPTASDVLLGWTILGDPTIVINQP